MNLNKTFANKKVIVTGHTGFKGSWLTLWLTKLGANVVSLPNPVNAVSNYEYETIRNEEKRNIFVLKSGFLQQFLDDIKEIMVYDESTQRIDDTTAQTENLNISMP